MICSRFQYPLGLGPVAAVMAAKPSCLPANGPNRSLNEGITGSKNTGCRMQNEMETVLYELCLIRQTWRAFLADAY